MGENDYEARIRGLEGLVNDLVQEIARLKSQAADAKSKLLQGFNGGQQTGFRPGEARHGLVGASGIGPAADEDHMTGGDGFLRRPLGGGELDPTDTGTETPVTFWNKSPDGGIDGLAEVIVIYIAGEWVVDTDFEACP